VVGLEIHSKFWVEREGELVLSDWRVRLLEAIDATGSLAAASAQLHVPYRVAWGKLKQIEKRLGFPLLHSHSGGAAGGSTRLTNEARDLVARYQRFRAGLPELVQQHFEAEFGGSGLVKLEA
jgi:molybdate transport system regulatory protein